MPKCAAVITGGRLFEAWQLLEKIRYAEVQKNSKVIDVKIRSLRDCSKSVTDTLYRKKFLVSECIFKISLRELQVIRDLLCVRCIPEKSLNRLLLLLVWKTSQRRCSVKKRPWKSCQFHRKIPVLESLFIKFAGLKAWSPLKKRLQHMFFSTEICKIFESTYNHGHNILELYNVLIQTQLTTSKSKLDI